MPRVSVIIPTFNRAAFIGEAIQSVLDQTYPDWELIVVDDGSTDETAQVVAQFGEQVTYIYQDNTGACAARNKGFAASRGELVSFLDSDDRMLPHNLETLIMLLDAKPEVSIGYGRYCWMDEEGRPIMPQWETDIVAGPMLEGYILPQLTMEEMLLGTSLIRRACIDAIDGFDETVAFAEHWDFYLRLARAGCAFACSKQAVTFVRFHPKNRGRDKEAMLAGWLNILDRLFDDPTLEATLASVHHQAYYNAYIQFARDFYALGYFEHGVQCLTGALQYGPLHSNDLTKISESMVTFALATEIEDPLKFTRDLFEPLPSTAQTGRLRGKVLGSVHAALAFRHYQARELNRVWRHALGAVSHDPSLWRNRGLVRIALEGLAGPRMVDWIRPRRHSHSTKLLDMAAQTTSIFISPHFDDAVLSCGGTLAQLARRGAEVTLVTVFTAEPTREMSLSPLARQLHREWGEKTNPYAMRRQEERAIAEYLNVNYYWLDFHDMIYRDPSLVTADEVCQAEFDPRSDPCFEPVRDALLQLINEHPGAMVIAPLGLGYHRDHLVVYQVLEAVKEMTSAAGGYYYYEDYPYAATANLQVRLAELDWKAEPLTVDIADTVEERVRLITMYPSQLSMLFDNPERIYEEIMAYATKVGDKDNPRERFWSARVDIQRNGTGSGRLI